MLDTIYLGWHYVLDDFGGVAIALARAGARPRADRADQAARELEVTQRADARFGARAVFAGAALLLVAVPFGLLLFLVEGRWSPLGRVDGGARDELHALARASSTRSSAALKVLSTIGSAWVYVPLFAAVGGVAGAASRLPQARVVRGRHGGRERGCSTRWSSWRSTARGRCCADPVAHAAGR